MKKILALIFAMLMVVSLVACEKAPDENSTVAEHMVYDFNNNADKTAQEIADLLLQSESLYFDGMSFPVEEGILSGFGNTEITGFEKGVMFGPAINTIPFIGYVFELSEDTDAQEFMQTIRDNADLRWNICTEADELIVENKGDKVIVIMTPEKFEDTNNQVDEEGEPVEGEMPVYGGEDDDFE